VRKIVAFYTSRYNYFKVFPSLFDTIVTRDDRVLLSSTESVEPAVPPSFYGIESNFVVQLSTPERFFFRLAVFELSSELEVIHFLPANREIFICASFLSS